MPPTPPLPRTGPARPPRRRRPGRRWLRGLVPLLLLAGAAAPGAGQELPLKRELPGTEAFRCRAFPTPVQPNADEQSQARQLASRAAQELILGNRDRARELLDRATELDPTSAAHAYQHGRILEDTGDTGEAVDEYCRALALNLGGDDAADARSRLETLAGADEPTVPVDAIAAFRTGLSRTDLGQLEAAAESFGRAATAAPGWPDAHYNRGVLLARLDRREEARAALRRYLDLAPGASDAIAVSERIGALQVVTPANLPSPGTAFAVGLVPGMGQVYTGRPAQGVGFLALAGGATAAGLLYDRGIQPEFRPVGLAIAGTTTALAALDGYLHARRLRAGADATPPDPGTALALGIVPGLGQIYSGRTATGLGFLTMTSLTVAATDLLETRDVRRFAPQGLVVAGAITAVGALESFVMADLHPPGSPPFRPDPWTALGLGLVPGMGQFYEGRTGMGMAVLGLSAGFTTAGLIYRIGRGVTFRGQGLAIGAGIVGLGALEAAIWAARHGDDPVSAETAAEPLRLGPLTLQGPALVGAGVRDGDVRVEMRLVGARFR